MKFNISNINYAAHLTPLARNNYVYGVLGLCPGGDYWIAMVQNNVSVIRLFVQSPC